MMKIETTNQKTKPRASLLRTVTLIFLAAVILMIAASVGFSYYDVLDETNHNFSDTAYSVSVILNDLYNAKEEPALLQSARFKQDERIEQISKMLRIICKDLEFQYLYVFDIDEETNSYLYYYTAAADDAVNDIVSRERGFGTVVKMDKIPQEVLDAKRGSTDGRARTTDNQYGRVYSWTYPIIDNHNEVQYLLGADISAGDMDKRVFVRSVQSSVPIAVLLLLIFIFLTVFIRRRVLKPVALISQKMDHFVREEGLKTEPIQISANNEIKGIADSFNKMQEDISRYIGEVNALTTERVQHQTQMEIASRIQNGIVPPETELCGEGFRVYAIERPCKDVGGDFYDCFVRDGDELCTVVGDVSGKGITAALFMVMAKTAIREKLMQGMNPAQALKLANSELRAANPERLFATVFVSVLSTKTGAFVYANAGHTLPVRLGQTAELFCPKPGVAIGLFKNIRIEDHTEQMQQGDGWLYYTDGVTEAMSKSEEFYGEERLVSALHGHTEPKSAVYALKNSVDAFCIGKDPFDDLTVLSFCYDGHPESEVKKQGSQNF